MVSSKLLTRIRVWRSFLTFISLFYSNLKELHDTSNKQRKLHRRAQGGSGSAPCRLLISGWAGRLAQQQFGAARNQEIRHRPDLLISLLFVECPRRLIEV